MQLGLQANNREDACADFAQSAKYYLEAVDNFLDDDEYVLIYLAVVFEAYMFQGKTVKEVLIITTKMDEALPRMLKVWENSSLKDARDPQIRAVLNFGNECMARVQAGNLSLDAVVKPRSMVSNVYVNATQDRSFELFLFFRKKMINGKLPTLFTFKRVTYLHFLERLPSHIVILPHSTQKFHVLN